MKNNKILKITEVINKYGHTLNLHEIKAKTGAGNGYKYFNGIDMSANNSTTKTYTHRSHKINDLLFNSNKKLNLHEIKAQTGAGCGYRY